jgi:hypothetical protein
MGYTHYWRRETEESKNVPTITWERFKIGAESIINQALDDGYAIISNLEDPADIILDDIICFNGVEEESHETFVIERVELDSFNFCKTARKPYDDVVVSVLAHAKAVLPGWKISSDGGDEVFENPKYTPIEVYTTKGL